MNHARMLLLLSMFAVSAIGTAQAQAEPVFRSSAANTEITVKSDGTGKTGHQVFDAGANGSITCSVVQLHGTQTGRVASEASVEAEYENCTFVGLSASVHMNGCQLVFHSAGTVDVAGAKCATEPIRFGVAGLCEAEVGPQSGLAGIDYHSVSATEVTAEGLVENVSGAASGIGCPTPGEFSGGTFTTGNVVVTGTNADTGEPANISVGPAEEPLFRSDATSTAFTGQGDGVGKNAHQVFDTGENGAITCSTVDLHGSQAGPTTSEVSVEAEYGGCAFIGLSTSIEMNGCHYVLHSDGAVDIGGGNCASEPITFGSGAVCQVTVGPQNGLREVTYSDIQGGRITVAAHVTGVEGEATGAGCIGTGPISGQLTTGNVIVTGTNLGDGKAANLSVE